MCLFKQMIFMVHLEWFMISIPLMAFDVGICYKNPHQGRDSISQVNDQAITSAVFPKLQCRVTATWDPIVIWTSDPTSYYLHTIISPASYETCQTTN